MSKLGLDNLNQEYLYRALRTDEDPYQDIVAKAPHSYRSIDEHVKDGLKNPSNYISTTTRFDLAESWKDTSFRKSNYQRGTTIVEIDVDYIKRECPYLSNSAYNFSDVIIRNHFLRDLSRDYARAYDEVVFERRIPSQVFLIYT